MRLLPLASALAALLAGCVAPGPGAAERDGPVIGTTTTTQDTGLLDVLLPAFERDTGFHPKAVVGGAGEIHEKGKRGDVDVLLTHSPARERGLVEEGWASARRPVMFNRFALAGPAEDPAGVRAAQDVLEALRRIQDNRGLFASRGDKSGTHEKELALWAAAGLDPARFDASWYKETGAPQGQTLLYASERGAYLLVDQGTLRQFHALGKARDVVDLHHEGDSMRNQYAVVLLDATRVPGIEHGLAQAFADWLTGPRGQAVIAAYEVDGVPLFTPNAGEAGA